MKGELLQEKSRLEDWFAHWLPRQRCQFGIMLLQRNMFIHRAFLPAIFQFHFYNKQNMTCMMMFFFAKNGSSVNYGPRYTDN